MAQVSECDIKFKNLEHYYHCYYESSNREESKIDEWLFVNLDVYKRQELTGADKLMAKLNKISRIESKKVLQEVAADVEEAIKEKASSFSDKERCV